MALSRTEIELLIKARDEAKGTFENLNKVVDNVGKSAGGAGNNVENLGKKTKTSGAAAGAAGVAFGLLADRLAQGLVRGIRSTITEANKLDAGLIGLSSVAKAFGQDAEGAKRKAQELADDGLLSVGEAATGLKNLLAAGFGLEEANTLMLRFKDSAAFGRQGALEFGQAIVSATEGVKNGNSILVDNAGVTKNLSQILVEAGFSAQDLSKASSDVGVRMALFNGIVKETNPQLGDAARFLGTAAGAQAKFSAQVTITQQKIGKELQPVLKSLIDTLTPVIRFTGEHTDAVLGFAGVLGTAAAAYATYKTAVTVATIAQGAFNSTLTISVAKLGLLGTAGTIAGAAIVGWNLGKIIGDLTGLNNRVDMLVNSYATWLEVSEVNKNKSFVLAEASKNAGRAVTDYNEAVRIQNDVHTIRLFQQDKTIEKQRQVIDAEERLGRITSQQAEARRQALTQEEQANTTRENRAALAQATADNEAKFRQEIEATGLTLGELQKALKTNEDAFESWAKASGLSDETIQRLKESTKEGTKAAEDAAKAAEKAEQAATQQRQALEQLEIITSTGVNKALGDFAALETRATSEGVPLNNVLSAMLPELTALAEQAKTSGIAIDENLTAAIKRATEAKMALIQTPPIPTVGLEEVAALLPQIDVSSEVARSKTEALEKAYRNLGQRGPQELRKLADEAVRSYDVIANSGTASAKQIKEAHERAVQAVNLANGKIPSQWRTEIVPGVKNALERIQAATTGTFAQITLGAKGFKDGFIDIWKSLQGGIKQILADILSHFTNSFLKGLLGAISGQQGAFAGAFAGLFGGGGGGIPGGFVGPTQGGGGGLAGLFGGGGLGSLLLGGGLTAGGLATLFAGGGGTGSNILGGAQTGAGIGTLIAPGIGTLIGGGLGALAGGIKSLFGGPSKDELAAREVVSGFEDILASGLTTEQRLEAGGERWRETVIRVRDAYAQLGLSEQQANDDVGALWESSRDGGTQTAAIIQTIATRLDEAKLKTAELTAVQEANAQQAEEAAQAIRQQHEERIAALDQEAQQILESIANEAPEETIGVLEQQARDRLAAIEQEKNELNAQVEAAVAEAEQVNAESAEKTKAQFRDVSEAMSQEITNAWDRINGTISGGLTIPYRFVQDGPGPPAVGGGELELPGAAQGIFASGERPVATFFGEGGEPEVGGPASFFKRIFESLGVDGGASRGVGGDGGTVVNISFYAQQVDVQTVRRDVIPEIIDAINGNTRQAKTGFKSALGIA